MVVGKAASESLNLLKSKPITVPTSDLTTFLLIKLSTLLHQPRVTLPSSYLTFFSLPTLYCTASLLPSFIEMQAQGMQEEGYLMCVCLGVRCFLTLSGLP